MAEIKELMVQLEDEALLEEVKKQLESGVSPTEIINACQDGMGEIGNLFSQGEMFVSDLMMAGAICKDVTDLVRPYIKKDDVGSSLGKVVIGTVKDDIHDIGKDIVCNMLEAAGFEVIDLGVDVDPETFVNAVKENNCKVVGLSCLLASCYGSIKKTVEAFTAAGLRDDLKIIVGGGPIDEHVVAYAGADAYGASAQDTVTYCKEVLGV